jgi:hypothetical protein
MKTNDVAPTFIQTASWILRSPARLSPGNSWVRSTVRNAHSHCASWLETAWRFLFLTTRTLGTNLVLLG